MPTFIFLSSPPVCQRQLSSYESWSLLSALTPAVTSASSWCSLPSPSSHLLPFLIACFFLYIPILCTFPDVGVLRSAGLAVLLSFGLGSSHLCLRGFGVSMWVSTMSVLSSAGQHAYPIAHHWCWIFPQRALWSYLPSLFTGRSLFLTCHFVRACPISAITFPHPPSASYLLPKAALPASFFYPLTCCSGLCK